jgi:hypothetical protein
MQANITINLSDEDTNNGMTVNDAVSKLFPSTPSPTKVAVTGLPAAAADPYPAVADAVRNQLPASDDLGAEDTSPEEGAETTLAQDVATAEQAMGTTLELDSERVPWSAKIHSSNRKMYASGPNKGRWIWKKGSDEAEREAIATELAAQVASAAPTTPLAEGNASTAQTAPAGTVPPALGYTPPGGQAAAGTTPPGLGATTVTPPVDGALPGNWPDFLKSLAPAGKTYADVDGFLPQFGMTSVSELSEDTQKLARDQIATALGLRSQA